MRNAGIGDHESPNNMEVQQGQAKASMPRPQIRRTVFLGDNPQATACEHNAHVAF